MKPTTLYVFQHAITKMMYLGKTTRSLDTYRGGGKYWRRHIEKHGKEHVILIWSKVFTDKDELVNSSLEISRKSNVTKSKLWANLQDENGVDGWVVGQSRPESKGVKKSKEHTIKLGINSKNRWDDEEYRKMMIASMKGVKKPESYKQNLSKISKERWADPEYRERLSKALSVPKSLNSKKNYSEAGKKRWADPEFREKMRLARIEQHRKKKEEKNIEKK